MKRLFDWKVVLGIMLVVLSAAVYYIHFLKKLLYTLNPLADNKETECPGVFSENTPLLK